MKFLQGLTLLFIGLKLGGPLADWSWFWVVSPYILHVILSIISVFVLLDEK